MLEADAMGIERSAFVRHHAAFEVSAIATYFFVRDLRP